MKKQLLSAIILAGVFTCSKAQKPDMAQVLVHYKFTHVRDTMNRTHPYQENMVLFVGKYASAYLSYDGIVENAQFKKAYTEAAANSPDGRVAINRIHVGSFTEYYQFPNDNKLFVKDRLMINSYLIEGSEPAINWTISNDTASFGGLHCQKATCHFKGRDYIAWFCPDLPVHSGPWKLNGLPGLIVDAHDTRNEVVFQFDGIEKAVPSAAKTETPDKDLPPILRGLNIDHNVIVPPADAIKTTQKEFDKMQETMKKDPNAFAQALMAGQRANMRDGGPKMDGLKVKSDGGGVVFNNPIELPENK